MPWDDGLDPASSTFGIAASEKSRIRVMAGPGTGKSFAMKRRVARLLEAGVDPKKILAVTFTRVAAEDLHRELVQMGVAGCDALEGKTLHSLGLQVLSRQHALEAVGRTPRPLNGFEEEALLCDLAAAFGGKREAGKLLEAYNAAWAQAQGDPPGHPAGSTEQAFSNAVLAWMLFHRSMLIGEIVPYFLVYLKNNPHAEEHTEFTHILADEYQDLNKAEQSIISYLANASDICIVGDDDQSIYSFKFANPDGIRDWNIANVGAVDFGLDDCHRCPQTVVSMANALIAHNQNRTPRALVGMPAKGPGQVSIRQFQGIADEVNFVTQEINALVDQGVPPGDMIVLIQRKKVGKLVYDSLRDALIPVKSYYEESELDSEDAQERFALFKLLLDPSDRVALRFLLGLGHNSLHAPAYKRLRDYCEQAGTSPWDALVALSAGQISIPYTNALVQRFAAINASLAPFAAVQNDLPALINDLFPVATQALLELREMALELLSELGGQSTAQELLKAMMLRITKPEVPASVHEVRVMSLHKSKGLSSPVVFVAGCAQGLLPRLPDPLTPQAAQNEAMEEQRRLFYVGITRVKADPANGKVGRLYLSYSRTMPAGLARQSGIQGFHQYGVANLQPSVFLGQLGNAAPAAIPG